MSDTRDRGKELKLTVEVSAGELLDKISILEIKEHELQDPAKLKNVRAELAVLVVVRDNSIQSSSAVAELARRLKEVNYELWRIEDEIREHERRADFGARFVELARSVYKRNDLRSTIKRSMNDLLGSRLVEEKSYA